MIPPTIKNLSASANIYTQRRMSRDLVALQGGGAFAYP
jgi:hypothetical protein